MKNIILAMVIIFFGCNENRVKQRVSCKKCDVFFSEYPKFRSNRVFAPHKNNNKSSHSVSYEYTKLVRSHLFCFLGFSKDFIINYFDDAIKLESPQKITVKYTVKEFGHIEYINLKLAERNGSIIYVGTNIDTINLNSCLIGM